ncbi:MAG: sulfatase-like hydrolase/transferase, partial [Verrucomicrobiales bacterium]|nr:sulfatase-like hydrolase/transferase [Verrucomicrobiales bacterium]
CELHHVRAHTFFQPTLWKAPGKRPGGLDLIPNSMMKYDNDAEYPLQPSNHNHPDYPETAYCDDMYAFAALDFLRVGAKHYNESKKPFFGLLAVQIPHAPFDEIAVLPGWDSAYADDPHFANLAPQSQQWAAMVTRIDAHFGNILTALDDPNGDGDHSDSVAKDTLVIFMSDNGGPGGKNNGEYDVNGGLRGNKGSIYEGGIRVPTVMRWPGKIEAGITNDDPIDVSDLLPTFCELAGCNIPVGLDGVSLAPLLTGKGDRRKRDFLIHEAGGSQSIIRGNHKLIRITRPAGKKKQQGKAASKPGEPQFALYDLDADHTEENNIAQQNPELVNELKTLLLGERVDEPKGFANTYHHWLGKVGASLNDPENWSDYVYENAGIVYFEDKGGPQLSWTATIGNIDKSNKSAKADSDLEFLSLGVWGLGQTEIVLGKNVNLTGRNEIRLGGNSVLTVDGGTVSSLRWVDVKKGGTIQGAGKIDAVLYNSGEVSLSGKAEEEAGLYVSRDYVESAGSSLKIELDSVVPALNIAGNAKLAGRLEIDITPEFSAKTGDVLTILTGKKIEGRFSNPKGNVRAKNGQLFRIGYSKNAVTLTAILRISTT